MTSVYRKVKSIAVAIGLCAAISSACALPTYAQSGVIPSKTIDLNLTGAPVRQALNIVFGGFGLNFTMDPAVSGTITLNLRSVPFETALKSVLKSANPPLVAIKDPDTGVYYVKVKDSDTGGASASAQQQSNAPAAPAAPVRSAYTSYAPSPAPYTPPAAAAYSNSSVSQFETITLKYLDPTVMAPIFGRMVVFHTAQSTGAGGGKGESAFGGVSGATGGASTTVAR